VILSCVMTMPWYVGMKDGLAAEPMAAAKQVDFSRQIRPILAKHCFACHGPETQESGLALHDFGRAILDSDNGNKAIVPGDSHASELIRRVSDKDPSKRMPPEGKGLSDNQIELLKGWIDSGAEYREHWAFLPLSHPTPPAISNPSSSFAGNPIDAFIQDKWGKSQLAPAAAAEPRSLIRRLYFDCIGVPPDLEIVEGFAANPTDEHYAQIVDALLADPRFGERMARDWLDVVRYAETNSFERDGPKPNAWKYRDYVIRSLNADKPYDRFLREQLAGDEINNPDREALTATGFYRLGIWDDEPADPEKATYDEYDDWVTTIGQGMLGLTLNCARCHDHKIDPIPQKDYYQMVAFLRDVSGYGTRGDERSNNQIDVSDDSLRTKNLQLKDRIRSMRDTLKSIEDEGIASMTDEDKQAAKSPDRDKVIREKLQSHISPQQWQEYQSLKKEIDDTRKEMESLPLDFRLGVAKSVPTPEQTFVLMRGLPQAHGDPVEPGYPRLFQDEKPQSFSPRSTSSGRRTQLVQWMTSPSNRLTSRVIANRIWQHHFGRGIVRSTNNFGQLGDPPTHPELLDFLAQTLIRMDWQLKPLHRMMLLSSTYRLSSSATTESIQKDPNNELFARFNVRRLSAEELRDAALTVNQRMNWKQSGPSFYPEVSDDVKAGQSVPGKGWGNSTEADRSRRSIYIHIKRSLIPPELSVFDFPETDSSCEARFLTTQAAQALNMLNGAFMQEQSKHLAAYASQRANNLTDRIRVAIETAYCRPAQRADLERATQRIASLQSKYGLDEQRAFREYCLVILNSNEFLYLD
jgi:mono/diheme cytochrome c family protein